MHVVVLVEEPSAQAALNILLPRILGVSASFEIIAFGGKHDLFNKLPQRLRGYRRWLPPDWRIVVLIDADRGPCEKVKARLEQIALEAKLATRTSTGGNRSFTVLNRLAVEELEAWFFGDPAAIIAAYPKVPASLGDKARFRIADAIHDPFEALERQLGKVGYHRGGLPKIASARAIAAHMDPERNRSRSFRLFRDSLRDLAAAAH